MRTWTAAAFTTPPISAYQGDGGRLLRAIRLWVMLARNGASPRAALTPLLGPAAARFSMLMEAAVVAWPEPFVAFPPCILATSPDEATLLALLSYAESDEMGAAHMLLCDMLPLTERIRLWQAATRVVAERIGTS